MAVTRQHRYAAGASGRRAWNPDRAAPSSVPGLTLYSKDGYPILGQPPVLDLAFPTTFLIDPAMHRQGSRSCAHSRNIHSHGA